MPNNPTSADEVAKRGIDHYFLRLIVGGLLGLALLIALGAGGYFAYARWQGARLVGRAQTYLAWGDLKSATLSASRAFQMNPKNAEACRVLASISELTSQASAINWRQRVLAIEPDSIEDKIALARTAIQFEQVPLAETTVAQLPPAAAQSPAYHDVRGQLALAQKDHALAATSFAEAVKLAPKNKLYQLNLATAQAQSDSVETSRAAATQLHSLLDDQALRLRAARALYDFAAQRHDAAGVLEVCELIRSYPEATFPDRISCLQVPRLLGSPEFSTALTSLENEATGNSGKLIALLSWMNSNQLAVLALDWAKRLPAEVTKRGAVAAAVAECYAATRDWRGLQDWCREVNWESLEFFRHAYLARAARELQDDLSFRSEWNSALQEAASEGESLSALQKSALKWGWPAESEDLLWRLSKVPEKQTAALAGLYEHYAGKADTGNLYRVVSRMHEIKPDDDLTKNSFAELSLLLGLNLKQAQEMAQQLYQKDPKNPLFVSTYALALHQKGLDQKAVQAMSELPPKELESAGMAAYYGIFLAGAGDKKEAAKYLEKSSGAPLFPEEKVLLQNAWEKVSGAPGR